MPGEPRSILQSTEEKEKRKKEIEKHPKLKSKKQQSKTCYLENDNNTRRNSSKR